MKDKNIGYYLVFKNKKYESNVNVRYKNVA